MAIVKIGGKYAIVPLQLSLDEIRPLLTQHAQEYPTQLVDLAVEKAFASGFAADDAVKLIQAVCRWGGYAGIGGRVAKQNDPAEIAGALKAALFPPNTTLWNRNLVQSLESILRLRGLGISFASKILKFLTIGHAVILDSTISEQLGYPLSIEGYRAWNRDCLQLVRIIHDETGGFPSGEFGDLKHGDIEAAIFMKLRNAKNVRA